VYSHVTETMQTDANARLEAMVTEIDWQRFGNSEQVAVS
jgi:hypothetical protein